MTTTAPTVTDLVSDINTPLTLETLRAELDQLGMSIDDVNGLMDLLAAVTNLIDPITGKSGGYGVDTDLHVWVLQIMPDGEHGKPGTLHGRLDTFFLAGLPGTWTFCHGFNGDCFLEAVCLN